MILSLRIALRLHRGAKNNILISLVSLIGIISITIGIMISIVALSIMHGFQYELNKRILSIIPHGEIQLINVSSHFNWKTVLKYIEKMPHIINISPYIDFPGMVIYKKKWHAIYIKSVDLTQNINIDGIVNFIEKKDWKYFCEHADQIILGKGVSDTLDIQIGDWITIYIPDNVHSDKNIFTAKKIRLQVSGILNLNSQLDCNLAIISLLKAQFVYIKKSDITGLAIKVDDVFRVDQILQNIKNIFGDSVYIKSWMDTYGYIFRDIQMVKIIIYLCLILIMGISCFNIITILILLIKNKNYDIEVLRVLGARNILIQNILFLYGLIIYLISGAMGVFFGTLISLYLIDWITYFNKLLNLNNFILLEKIYFINFIPVKINGWDIFFVLVVTLLIGLFTSWYATLKIQKTNSEKILK